MKKRTRLTVTYILSVYLMGLAIFAVSKSMETLAITIVTALTGAILTYIWGETKRPSNN